MKRLPENTPWGPIQHKEKLADGIYDIETAGHGGIWIAPGLRHHIPKCKNFLDSTAWWEEDCDWSIPFYVFADRIKPNMDKERFDFMLDAAKKTIAYWHPEMDCVY